jgi:broad specificity phosphatase PhoE
MRLLLISHAAGGHVRGDGLEDEGLADAARLRARELGRLLPRPRAAFTSPALRATQMADALGYAAVVARDLRDWEHVPPVDESLDDLIVRVRGWLAQRTSEKGTQAAVTHGAVIRAAVLIATLAPPEAFEMIDVAPCSATELRFREGRWHVGRVNWEPVLLHIPHGGGRRKAPAKRS